MSMIRDRDIPVRPEPPEPGTVVIRSSSPAVLAAVKDFALALEKQRDSDDAIIRALTSVPAPPQAEHLEQLRRNAELRLRFMSEVPLLKSADVAKLSGSSARNAAAKANRWKSEGRIFSVPHGGVDYYPAFQFTVDGEPVPELREVLAIFSELAEWPIALWFFLPDGWLGRQPPMDVLQRDPEAVIRAARHAVEEIEG